MWNLKDIDKSCTKIIPVFVQLAPTRKCHNHQQKSLKTFENLLEDHVEVQFMAKCFLGALIAPNWKAATRYFRSQTSNGKLLFPKLYKYPMVMIEMSGDFETREGLYIKPLCKNPGNLWPANLSQTCAHAVKVAAAAGRQTSHSWFLHHETSANQDDVIKWKRLPSYRPFVWGIHQSPVNSLKKGRWRGASMFSLICAWTNGWVNNCPVIWDAITVIMTSR